MASAPLNWLLKIGADALQTTAQTICAAINELKTDKANKASNPTNGHFAAVDASGNVTDSGRTYTLGVSQNGQNIPTAGAVYTAINTAIDTAIGDAINTGY